MSPLDIFRQVVAFVCPRSHKEHPEEKAWTMAAEFIGRVEEGLVKDPQVECIRGIAMLQSLSGQEYASMVTGIVLGAGLSYWTGVKPEQVEKALRDAEESIRQMASKAEAGPVHPNTEDPDMPEPIRKLIAFAKENGINVDVQKIDMRNAAALEKADEEDEPIIH